jgi:predicted negative regulator of RcsB-dependent stress response
MDKLWVWGDAHKKHLLIGSLIVLVVGLLIAFYFAHQTQEQTDANFALSKLVSRNVSPTTPGPGADALLKVGNDYPGTDAGQRALLLGAAGLFADGKYDEARAQFQRFLQEHADSPFVGEAALGVAATFDAQGRAQDAINAYRIAADHYPGDWNVAPQARLALARLLEAQGKFADAKGELMDAGRTYPGEIGSEIGMRLRELFIAHPELIPTNPAPTSSSVLERPTRPAPSAPGATTPTNRPPAAAPFVITPPPTNKP